MKKFLTGILVGCLLGGVIVYFLVSDEDGDFIKPNRELANQYAREFQQRMNPEFVRSLDLDNLETLFDASQQFTIGWAEARREYLKRINDEWIDSVPVYPRPLDVITPNETIVMEDSLAEGHFFGDDLTARQRIILLNHHLSGGISILFGSQRDEILFGSSYVFSSENIGNEKYGALRFSPIAGSIIIYRSEDSKNVYLEHYNKLVRVGISVNDDGYYVPGKVWVSDV